MRKIMVVTLIVLSLVVPTVYANSADLKNPYGISKVDPVGPNEIIFTVSKGKKIQNFTAEKIANLKSYTITIFEPFVKKEQKFVVIPIASFFKLVGISGSDKVSTMALNDYVYKNTAMNFLAAQTLVAIKKNGSEIAYDQGGPIRLIFAGNSRWAKQKDAWNWSLRSISVS